MSEEKRVQEWPEKVALELLKNILLEYGEDLSRSQYEKLNISSRLKPSATALRRIFGTWGEAKARALPDSTDVKKQYLVKQNRALLEQLDKQRSITQVFVDNCLAAIEKLHFRPVKIPKRETTKENLEFHSMRSDAHVGQYEDEKWLQGVAHYDSGTYQERHSRWLERLLLFREQDKRSLGLNKLVIHYLGDQVTGEQIFRGQAFYLDLYLTDQLFLSQEVETNGILTLAQHFSEIEIFCVIGNHGRPGRKGEHHAKTNFDYLFYRGIQSALKQQKNVKVFVSECPSMLIQHGNYTFILNHGDKAIRWMGLPYYGLERLYRRLPGLYNRMIHYELVAHHHQAGNIADKIILNGSMVGGSDLSVNVMGLADLASQKIFYFHPVHGINRESNLYLSDPPDLQPDEEGIFTAYV